MELIESDSVAAQSGIKEGRTIHQDLRLHRPSNTSHHGESFVIALIRVALPNRAVKKRICPQGFFSSAHRTLTPFVCPFLLGKKQNTRH